MDKMWKNPSVICKGDPHPILTLYSRKYGPQKVSMISKKGITDIYYIWSYMTSIKWSQIQYLYILQQIRKQTKGEKASHDVIIYKLIHKNWTINLTIVQCHGKVEAKEVIHNYIVKLFSLMSPLIVLYLANFTKVKQEDKEYKSFDTILEALTFGSGTWNVHLRNGTATENTWGHSVPLSTS